MSEWTDTQRGALIKLIERAERDPEFTPTEVEVIKKIAAAAVGLFALGRLAKWTIFVLAAVAGAMTAWEQVKTGVAGWFAG